MLENPEIAFLTNFEWMKIFVEDNLGKFEI